MWVQGAQVKTGAEPEKTMVVLWLRMNDRCQSSAAVSNRADLRMCPGQPWDLHRCLTGRTVHPVPRRPSSARSVRAKSPGRPGLSRSRSSGLLDRQAFGEELVTGGDAHHVHACRELTVKVHHGVQHAALCGVGQAATRLPKRSWMSTFTVSFPQAVR